MNKLPGKPQGFERLLRVIAKLWVSMKVGLINHPVMAESLSLFHHS
ncbi:MAG: hypothetical protein QOJ02_2551 [Acidobacteriota bacterium]|jgi:hypothetical protein|nr:hypothetical protein [Acidobacteriota bacterium]